MATPDTTAGTATTTDDGVTHMMVLRPPSRSGTFWSPWRCICGAGACGGDDAMAEKQYQRHLRGLWPAFTGPVPGTHPYVEEDGSTIWVYD